MAARAIRTAIPSATVSAGSFQIVLNGLTVELPVRPAGPAQPRCRSLPGSIPSLRYTLALDRSPAVIAAPALTAATGATRRRDEDRRRRRRRRPAATPSSTPTASPIPAGFPKGQRTCTTPKVIAARSFPGPAPGAPAGFRSTERVLPRHACRRDRGRAQRHELAGRQRPPADGRALGRRSPGLDRQLPRLQRAVRLGHIATRPRSSPPSRPPSATGWT